MCTHAVGIVLPGLLASGVDTGRLVGIQVNTQKLSENNLTHVGILRITYVYT